MATEPGPEPQPAYQKLSFKKEAIPPQLLALIRKLQKSYLFFGDMLDEEVSQFLKLCRRENFEDGKKIFSQGELGNSFYLVVSGGAQGITVQMLAALASQAPKFLLLGRTDLPDEAAQ